MVLAPRPIEKNQLIDQLEFIVKNEGDSTLSIEGFLDKIISEISINGKKRTAENNDLPIYIVEDISRYARKNGFIGKKEVPSSLNMGGEMLGKEAGMQSAPFKFLMSIHKDPEGGFYQRTNANGETATIAEMPNPSYSPNGMSAANPTITKVSFDGVEGEGKRYLDGATPESFQELLCAAQMMIAAGRTFEDALLLAVEKRSDILFFDNIKSAVETIAGEGKPAIAAEAYRLYDEAFACSPVDKRFTLEFLDIGGEAKAEIQSLSSEIEMREFLRNPKKKIGKLFNSGDKAGAAKAYIDYQDAFKTGSASSPVSFDDMILYISTKGRDELRELVGKEGEKAKLDMMGSSESEEDPSSVLRVTH